MQAPIGQKDNLEALFLQKTKGENSMPHILASEHLKYKRSFAKRLTLFTPLLFILISLRVTLFLFRWDGGLGSANRPRSTTGGRSSSSPWERLCWRPWSSKRSEGRATSKTCGFTPYPRPFCGRAKPPSWPTTPSCPPAFWQVPSSSRAFLPPAGRSPGPESRRGRC